MYCLSALLQHTNSDDLYLMEHLKRNSISRKQTSNTVKVMCPNEYNISKKPSSFHLQASTAAALNLASSPQEVSLVKLNSITAIHLKESLIR